MTMIQPPYKVWAFRPFRRHPGRRVALSLNPPGRDLHRLDTSTGQDRVKRRGELTGPVADEEPEVCCAITEIHHKDAPQLAQSSLHRCRSQARQTSGIPQVITINLVCSLTFRYRRLPHIERCPLASQAQCSGTERYSSGLVGQRTGVGKEAMTLGGPPPD